MNDDEWPEIPFEEDQVQHTEQGHTEEERNNAIKKMLDEWFGPFEDTATSSIDEARKFYKHFCSQEGCYLRLRPDTTIAIGVPEELSDVEFEAIRVQVDAQIEALREVLRMEVAA